MLASQTISTFQSTIEKLYLPHVRRAISNDWKAFQESEVLYTLYVLRDFCLPKSFFTNLEFDNIEMCLFGHRRVSS